MNARVGHAGDMAYPSELCLAHNGNGVGDVCLLQNLFVKDLHHLGFLIQIGRPKLSQAAEKLASQTASSAKKESDDSLFHLCDGLQSFWI